MCQVKTENRSVSFHRVVGGEGACFSLPLQKVGLVGGESKVLTAKKNKSHNRTSSLSKWIWPEEFCAHLSGQYCKLRYFFTKIIVEGNKCPEMMYSFFLCIVFDTLW